MNLAFTAPRIAHSYLRISTKRQGKEGRDGIRRQDDLAERWIAKNPGYVLSPIRFRDLGLSGFRGLNRQRGALGAFLAAIENCRILPGEVLIVENLDRLSREEPLDAIDLVRGIVKAGVDIITIQDDAVYSKATLGGSGHLMHVLLAHIQRAHFESQQKSERVGSAWRYKKARAAAKPGLQLSKTCPGWIDPVGSGYAPNPVGAATVRKMFELASQGHSASFITAYLTARPTEHPTLKGTWQATRGSNGWYQSYVAKVLADRRVIGEHQPTRYVDGKRLPEGDVILGHYPALIEPELFERVQEIRRTNPSPVGRKGSQYSNLFTGLCRCDRCSTASATNAMNITNNGGKGSVGHLYLRCHHNARSEVKTCLGQFRYQYVEDAILSTVPEWRLSDLTRDRGSDGRLQELDRQLGAARIEAVRLEGKKQRWMTLFEDGHGENEDLSLVRDRVRELGGDIKDAKARMAALEFERVGLVRTSARGLTIDHDIAAMIRGLNAGEGDERPALRMRLAAALREFITDIRFDVRAQTFTVIILNGIAAYRFGQVNGKERRFELKGHRQLSPQVGTHSGAIPAEAFGPENVERVRMVVEAGR